MLARLLVWLSHRVPAFEPTPAQLATLSARLDGGELVVVHSEPELPADPTGRVEHRTSDILMVP